MAWVLTGCVTLPGHPAPPEFASRIVDREFGVVWRTLLAAVRNEGAQVAREDQERGEIVTAFRRAPGTRVLARALLGSGETQHASTEVRYTVRARPLGSEKTEVRLRTEVRYLDRGTGHWMAAADDGSLAESFWRRLDQDLAYYGARPERWGSEGDGSASGPPAAGGQRGRP